MGYLDGPATCRCGHDDRDHELGYAASRPCVECACTDYRDDGGVPHRTGGIAVPGGGGRPRTAPDA